MRLKSSMNMIVACKKFQFPEIRITSCLPYSFEKEKNILMNTQRKPPTPINILKTNPTQHLLEEHWSLRCKAW
jgi:hypothetical protein